MMTNSAPAAVLRQERGALGRRAEHEAAQVVWGRAIVVRQVPARKMRRSLAVVVDAAVDLRGRGDRRGVAAIGRRVAADLVPDAAEAGGTIAGPADIAVADTRGALQ